MKGGGMGMRKPADWSFGATIPSKDTQNTRKFYEDVLGLEVVLEYQGGITYRSGDSFLTLYPSEFAGIAKHTLGGFTVRDFDRAAEQLRAKGVKFEDYDMPGLKTENGVAEMEGMKAAWFKDPEGNILSLAQMPPTP
jgi:catechol 2,3-dioxygenase-like lactoylglutathione lyase family enzyme